MSSLGSVIGSDASLGIPAHAARSSGKMHAIARLTRLPAPRMPLVLSSLPRLRARVFAKGTAAADGSLANRVGQAERMLPVASHDDCCLFASSRTIYIGIRTIWFRNGYGALCVAASAAGWP